jgi:hypothetical protein
MFDRSRDIRLELWDVRSESRGMTTQNSSSRSYNLWLCCIGPKLNASRCCRSVEKSDSHVDRR